MANETTADSTLMEQFQATFGDAFRFMDEDLRNTATIAYFGGAMKGMLIFALLIQRANNPESTGEILAETKADIESLFDECRNSINLASMKYRAEKSRDAGIIAASDRLNEDFK